MSKQIEVTLKIEVPDIATDDDIESWIYVELCGWNSMSCDNPCIGEAEVTDMTWDD